MKEMRLKSANSDAAIEFAEVDGDYFRATIVSSDHFATCRVFAYTDAKGIVQLFAEAAQDWKGWDGGRVWESIEGELRLELHHDKLGHITLGVRICSDPGGPDSWRLEANIALEAGQLEQIAHDADYLWNNEA